jgi:hypothetical protein
MIKSLVVLALSVAAMAARDAATAAPETVHFTSLDGTTNHAFDAPDLELRELPQYRNGDRVPLEGSDEEARADSILRVLPYLKRTLE